MHAKGGFQNSTPFLNTDLSSLVQFPQNTKQWQNKVSIWMSFPLHSHLAAAAAATIMKITTISGGPVPFCRETLNTKHPLSLFTFLYNHDAQNCTQVLRPELSRCTCLDNKWPWIADLQYNIEKQGKKYNKRCFAAGWRDWNSCQACSTLTT